MKPSLPILTIFLVLSISHYRCQQHPDFGGYYNDPNIYEELESEWENQPVEDSIPANPDYYENATFTGTGSPPTGNTIQPFFGYIVPYEYQNGNSSNSSNVVTLQVGAQFIAEYAFIKNLFINSNHFIMEVYDMNVTHTPNAQNLNGESVDTGNYTYNYDVGLLSSYHERLRAKFAIITSVYEGNNNFWMKNFTFRYNSMLRGERNVMQLTWWRDDPDNEVFQYNLADDQSNPHTELVFDNTSLTVGENITADLFLAREGWKKIDNDIVNTNAPVSYVYQCGFAFVNYQLQNPPVNSSIYDESQILNVYEKYVSANVTKYRINVETGVPNDLNAEKANVSYEVVFDDRLDYYYIYAWSVMTHFIPSSLPA